MGKFVIRRAANGIRFDLKAINGATIAFSESCPSEQACREGIVRVQRCAPAALVEDQTVKGYVTRPCPKFEIFVDPAGRRPRTFRFRLKDADGNVIAVSDVYRAAAGCRNGIASVRKNAPFAPVVMIED